MPRMISADDPFATAAADVVASRPPAAPLGHVVEVSIAIGTPIVGAVVAMWTAWRYGWFDWTQFTIMVAGYLLTGAGITIGYHRLLAHRSFQTFPVVRVVLMVLGALAVQKSPIEWCAVHRKHHATSDEPGDPHSPHAHPAGPRHPLRGFLHAHVGWIFTGHLVSSDAERYAPDLLRDPLAVFIQRTWAWLWLPLAFVIPMVVSWSLTGTAAGVLMGFLWGGCMRLFLVHHVTFSTNSICHLFGSRPFRTGDESRNNFLCGVVSGGEGFHNNHHAFPTSARHGLEWWQIDASWYVIWILRELRLAWDVTLPTPAMLADRRLHGPAAPRR